MALTKPAEKPDTKPSTKPDEDPEVDNELPGRDRPAKPDHDLPGHPAKPDQGLPGRQPVADQDLPDRPVAVPKPKGPVFDKSDREWIADCAEALMIARVTHSGSREIPSGPEQCANVAKHTVSLATALRTEMLNQTVKD